MSRQHYNNVAVTMGVILIVTGSRDYQDRDRVRDSLRGWLDLHAAGPHLLYVGDCRGPDTWATEYWREQGLHGRIFPANWEKDGKAAGPTRNRQMVAEAVWTSSVEGRPLAFRSYWDGRSRGTLDMLRRLAEAGIGGDNVPPLGSHDTCV